MTPTGESLAIVQKKLELMAAMEEHERQERKRAALDAIGIAGPMTDKSRLGKLFGLSGSSA